MAEETTPVATAKRGRKPRFTPDQLRARTLGAGIESVVREGLSFGADAIRIDRVIIEADTPRAATYEYWAERGAGTSQENLRRATVIDFLTSVPAGNAERTTAFVMDAAAGQVENLASRTSEQRRAIRRELIRVGAGFNYNLLQDQRWRVYKTFTSAIGTQSDEELRAAVALGEERLLSSYGAMFSGLADLFQMKLRAPLTVEQFVMSTYALNEGLSNRLGSTFVDQTVELDNEPWTIFAIGLEALVDRYFYEDFVD